MRKFILGLIFLFVLHTDLPAQTGPGGVGDATSNGLWLRADAIDQADGTEVASWADRSAFGNDAFQPTASFRPVYRSTSNLNGMPVVELDGTDDRLFVADADVLDDTEGITYFAVIRPSNLDNSPRGILGKRISSSVNAEWAYTWFFWENRTINLDVVTNNDRVEGIAPGFTNATNYIMSWDFDGTLPSSDRVRLYRNSDVLTVAAETSSRIINSNRDLVIGALNDEYRAYLGADYAEIIQYNYALSSLERNLVNTYLSARYAIPLAAGDLYAYDTPAEGDFDHDVAGIGRDASGDQIREARGSGIVSFSGPAVLPDDAYLTWGNDGGELALSQTTDLAPGTTSRSGRTWRANERTAAGTAADLGAVDLTFDLSGTAAPPPPGDLRLIVDTDGDGSFADELPIAGAQEVGTGSYRFTGVDQLSDGSRLTVAVAETALPGRFYDFSARVTEADVRLDWSIFQEDTGEFFAVDRSADGVRWSELSRINLDDRDDYFYLDRDVPLQRAYYRVRQVGYDGTFTVTPVREVRLETADERGAFPNPFSTSVSIRGAIDPDHPPVLFDRQGRAVDRPYTLSATGRGVADLDGYGLRPGIYLLRWPDGRSLRLIRR